MRPVRDPAPVYPDSGRPPGPAANDSSKEYQTIMQIHPSAGQKAPETVLADLPALVSAYYTLQPDPEQVSQRVSFGTSGHRGSSLRCSFNQDHILVITQAICDYRRSQGISGPLFLAHDTHALSEPARRTALEVLAANEVSVLQSHDDGPTPTPAVSLAILEQRRRGAAADGIIITPSHNPPEDGGFKYNPPHGGPADTDVTKWIEARANQLLKEGGRGVKRIPFSRALRAQCVGRFDFRSLYVDSLADVIRFEPIRAAGLRLAADPMGGAGLHYWDPIAERYGLQITVVNRSLDPTFRFMSLDWDGRIRMDCSSPYAMAGLIRLKDDFDLAFGNDSDFDRHGIVTPTQGLMNPNHFLAAAIWYLFQNRPQWPGNCAVGKTLVSSSMIDRVAAHLGRRLVEVPVGFKWFVPGLLDGSLGFGGEESAGASFLRQDGSVWTTEKDGIILALLAAEITAVTGRDPSRLYHALEERFGSPVYERIDTPATPQQKAALARLSPDGITVRELAGEPILQVLTRAPGNGAEIGGVKVVAQNGWFAARPSGTEDVCKLYAESFLGREHLSRIQAEAQAIIAAAT